MLFDEVKVCFDKKIVFEGLFWVRPGEEEYLCTITCVSYLWGRAWGLNNPREATVTSWLTPGAGVTCLPSLPAYIPTWRLVCRCCFPPGAHCTRLTLPSLPPFSSSPLCWYERKKMRNGNVSALSSCYCQCFCSHGIKKNSMFILYYCIMRFHS